MIHGVCAGSNGSGGCRGAGVSGIAKPTRLTFSDYMPCHLENSKRVPGAPEYACGNQWKPLPGRQEEHGQKEPVWEAGYQVDG